MIICMNELCSRIPFDQFRWHAFAIVYGAVIWGASFGTLIVLKFITLKVKKFFRKHISFKIK